MSQLPRQACMANCHNQHAWPRACGAVRRSIQLCCTCRPPVVTERARGQPGRGGGAPLGGAPQHCGQRAGARSLPPEGLPPGGQLWTVRPRGRCCRFTALADFCLRGTAPWRPVAPVRRVGAVEVGPAEPACSLHVAFLGAQVCVQRRASLKALPAAGRQEAGRLLSVPAPAIMLTVGYHALVPHLPGLQRHDPLRVAGHERRHDCRLPDGAQPGAQLPRFLRILLRCLGGRAAVPAQPRFTPPATSARPK